MCRLTMTSFHERTTTMKWHVVDTFALRPLSRADVGEGFVDKDWAYTCAAMANERYRRTHNAPMCHERPYKVMRREALKDLMCPEDWAALP